MKSDDVNGAELVRGEVLSEWIDCYGHMHVASHVPALEVAVRERIQAYVEADPCLAVPPEARRQICLRKPIYSVFGGIS